MNADQKKKQETGISFIGVHLRSSAANTLLFAVALLLYGCCAWGQMNTAEIGGRVQDATGGVLPGATVTIRHLDTKQEFTAVSNSAGEYLFAQVPVGAYSLTVTAADFKQSEVPRLEFHAGDRLRQNFV